MNIVQDDGNTVFSNLATLVHSKLARGKLRTLEKDCRSDRDFILDPYVRIPEVKGLDKVQKDALPFSRYYPARTHSILVFACFALHRRNDTCYVVVVGVICKWLLI